MLMTPDKRTQILEATADLIAKQGLQSCPMAKVAKHAGVGAGTIYRYFETKEVLIQQLYFDICQELEGLCTQSYCKDASFRERFDHIWGGFYQYLLKNPRNLVLLDQLWASPAVGEAAHRQAMTEIHGLTLQLLQEAKDAKAIKPLQNEILLTITFGSLFNIAKKQLQSPALFTEPVVLGSLLDTCWDAIKNN